MDQYGTLSERDEHLGWLSVKTVHIDKVPQTLTARIAADSKYWLWINGRLVVFEGGLKRGPSPYDTYYDPVEIAPYLQNGENTIAVPGLAFR